MVSKPGYADVRPLRRAELRLLVRELPMKLIAVQPLGRNRDNARLWIESQRLDRLGFPAGTPIQVESQSESLTLRPAVLAENHVSSRAVAGGRRPIIDLANQSILSGLAEYSEVKIIAAFERIEVTPSRRAFAIAKSRTLNPPLRVLEVFAGGGTMTAALDADPCFQLVAGVEIEPDYADEWQARHPDGRAGGRRRSSAGARLRGHFPSRRNGAIAGAGSAPLRALRSGRFEWPAR